MRTHLINACGLGVCAIAALLILPALALAQQAGIKAGVNFASLTPEEDEDPDTSRLIGLVGGGWFRTASTTRFSFQVEGLFSEKGVKFDAVAIDFDTVGTLEIRVRYIEIPLLARVDLGSRSTTRVFVVGGAAPAFELSGRVSAEFGGQKDTRDFGNQIKPFDVGLVGGLGVELGRALVEARYTHGLLNISEDDNNPEDFIYHRVFSVTVGFRLW
jgi:Outer membrane protein beta-barrel domain